jgi:hypothetical protein
MKKKKSALIAGIQGHFTDCLYSNTRALSSIEKQFNGVQGLHRIWTQYLKTVPWNKAR